MQATIVPTSNISAYIIRVEVEFRQEGHDAQHNEQAVLPQHHASCKMVPLVRVIYSENTVSIDD